MTAIERITEACNGIPDNGYARIPASIVVEAGRMSEDPRVKCLVNGAQRVIDDFAAAAKEMGAAPPGFNDPRMDVMQLAGELRHLVAGA